MNYQINEDKLLFTQLGDEGVLYDTETNEYLTANETFYIILKSIDEGASIEQIVAKLCSLYKISEETCLAEVNKVIDSLLQKQYILA